MNAQNKAPVQRVLPSIRAGTTVRRSPMPAIEPPTGTRALAVTAAGAATLMLLTGCGVIRDLQGTREHPEPEPASEETEDPRAEAETDFPYTRQGPVFQDTGQDSTLRFAITNMERTDDYIVMHYESTYVDHFEGINHNLGLSPTIVDPISGQDRKSTRLNSSHVATSYAV